MSLNLRWKIWWFAILHTTDSKDKRKQHCHLKHSTTHLLVYNYFTFDKYWIWFRNFVKDNFQQIVPLPWKLPSFPNALPSKRKYSRICSSLLFLTTHNFFLAAAHLTKIFSQGRTRYFLWARVHNSMYSLKHILYKSNTQIGEHNSFLWGHSCFGLLVTSGRGFKARVDSLACVFSRLRTFSLWIEMIACWGPPLQFPCSDPSYVKASGRTISWFIADKALFVEPGGGEDCSSRVTRCIKRMTGKDVTKTLVIMQMRSAFHNVWWLLVLEARS